MRIVHRLVALPLLLVAACQPRGDAGHDPGNPDITPGRFPRYDQVFRKATHNSFWLDAAVPSNDFGASGTEQRLVDQLLFEHVRAFEFDIHPDAAPGQFRVFHTADADSNSSCRTLADCLEPLRRLGYLVPQHEVVNVVIELKEIYAHTFDATHHVADLDRQLRDSLGARLYTPRDFLARCPGVSTLSACLAAAGWPTTDQLRGRVIANVIGNWADNYVDWVDYATVDGGVAERAAFPLRSMLNTRLDQVGDKAATALAGVPNDPYIEISGGSEAQTSKPDPGDVARVARSGALVAAREASIFWQMEDLDIAWSDFRDRGGMARSKDAHDPYNADAVAQKDVVTQYGFQMIQTDFPWHFISDDPALRGEDAAVPTLAGRAFFEACDALGGRYQKGQPGCKLDAAVLTEPGNRLLLADGSALWQAAPASSHVWETQPSATSITHDGKLEPFGRPGAHGCLTARSGDGAAHVELCRFVDSDGGRSVHVTLAAVGAAGGDVSADWLVPAQHAEPGAVGDLLRLTVTVDASGTSVSVASAGIIGADGAPAWSPLPRADLGFPGVALTAQGVTSTGQSLFVATRRDGALVGAQDFDGVISGALVDQSH